jgi:YbbR domain-containing protein
MLMKKFLKNNWLYIIIISLCLYCFFGYNLEYQSKTKEKSVEFKLNIDVDEMWWLPIF